MRYSNPLVRYGLAFALTAAAIALRGALGPILGETSPLILLLIAPTLAAYWCGLGSGLLATAASGIAGVALFIPPIGYWLPVGTADWVRLCAFLGLGSLITWALHARSVTLRDLIEDRDASRHRQAESEESARRFRAILENVQAVGLVLDADGSVSFVNDYFLRLTGWRAEEVVGQNWFARFVPQDASESAAQLEAAFREHVASGSISRHRENEIVTRTGERRVIAWDNTVLRGLDGTVTGVASIGRDVTDERAAAARLRASEAHLAAVFRQTGAALAETDMDGRFVAVNDRYCELVGRTRESLLGRSFAEITHADDLPANARCFEHLRATGESFSMEKRYVRPDGGIVWVTNDVTRIEPPDAPPRILAVSIDVTQRKHAEAQLRASEARLRAVFERAAVGMARASFTSTSFVEVNAALCRMLGYTREELTSRPWTSITHPDDVDLDLAPFRRMGAGELDAYSVEKRFIHRDGHEVWARLGLSLVRDGDGRPDYEIAVIEDITERKRHERTLLDADRRKDEFLATLAHELRNPLAPLRNALTVLERSDDAAACARARAMMGRQLAQLVRLVDDLLDVSRITTGKLRLSRARIEIQHVVDAAIETAGPTLQQRRQTLVVEPAPAPVWLTGDAVRLAQVLTNLLNNAAKYSAPDGTIAVRVEVPHAGRVRIAVQDTGVGIAADALEHVFDLFAQVDAAAEHADGGLGIGLSLARRLVELHGGTLRAQSPGPGRGSTFTIELPTTMRERPARAPRPVPESAAAERCRVVVADDNRDAADSLALVLRLHGHEVHTGYDGEEALAAVHEHRPDVAILDIGMPQHDGCEVARRLRAAPEHAGIVLVAITGWGQEADKQRTASAGFDRHFTKPVDPAEVEAVLNGLRCSSRAALGR